MKVSVSPSLPPSLPPSRGTLSFNMCADLKNPWNDNKPVKISRDGQVSWGCGSWGAWLHNLALIHALPPSFPPSLLPSFPSFLPPSFPPSLPSLPC